ncbi:MAG TPA: class I SAM-dependent methyltransferase [Armatimonadetes bacterium]|jgi:SAM-dependent methyltransferase|nr:class I SAM-dependent methyltransferase [Armatimonadota bacterium]
MDHREAGRYWDGNADAWTRLAHAGYDAYRDHLNTPAFLEMLPEVEGLRGLDIGCGEGHNTRLVAGRGARMTAADISERFIHHALCQEREQPLGIRYLVASAVELPFPEACFDFITSFMCLMDIPEYDRALAETYRVLKPGGFLQFSITHPCFDTAHRRKVRNEQGVPYAYELGGYFTPRPSRITEWLFSAAPPEATRDLPKFQVPHFPRTLSDWLNTLVETGFVLERVSEPCPSDAALCEWPEIEDARIVAYFLHIRCRKPG